MTEATEDGAEDRMKLLTMCTGAIPAGAGVGTKTVLDQTRAHGWDKNVFFNGVTSQSGQRMRQLGHKGPTSQVLPFITANSIGAMEGQLVYDAE